MRIIQLPKLFMIFWCLFTAQASLADGNQLLVQCTAAEHFLNTQDDSGRLAEIGMCLGLVQGVSGSLLILKEHSEVKACFPEGKISNGQAVRIVNSYLKQNPGQLHQNEVMLSIVALVQAFPCK